MKTGLWLPCRVYNLPLVHSDQSLAPCLLCKLSAFLPERSILPIYSLPSFIWAKVRPDVSYSFSSFGLCLFSLIVVHTYLPDYIGSCPFKQAPKVLHLNLDTLTHPPLPEFAPDSQTASRQRWSLGGLELVLPMLVFLRKMNQKFFSYP